MAIRKNLVLRLKVQLFQKRIRSNRKRDRRMGRERGKGKRGKERKKIMNESDLVSVVVEVKV